MAEDPANRRVHGGSHRRDIIHLIPASWPEVTNLATGPAIYHAEDFSLVGSQKPARAGEQLIMSVSGLGPTRPGSDIGEPFPPYGDGTKYEVSSPVEVTVNGQQSRVVNKIGWPEATNLYRVDFVVPDGTAPGMASIQVSASWITGPEVKIPVR